HPRILSPLLVATPQQTASPSPSRATAVPRSLFSTLFSKLVGAIAGRSGTLYPPNEFLSSAECASPSKLLGAVRDWPASGPRVEWRGKMLKPSGKNSAPKES